MNLGARASRPLWVRGRLARFVDVLYKVKQRPGRPRSRDHGQTGTQTGTYRFTQ